MLLQYVLGKKIILEKPSSAITVVVSSRDDANIKQEFIKHVQNTCGCVCHLYFLVNSGVALTKIYDDMMKKPDGVDDVIIFMHDDIEFLREGWGTEVLRLFNTYPEYGIIGVAGSAEFDSGAAWWNYKKKYGQVLHRHDGKAWLTAFSPLLDHDLEEVCVIDGLFMAVHKQRVTEPFDLDFGGFNHYDTSFCLANYLDGMTKIGVTTNIRIAHNSVGEMKDEWYVNREILNRKFGEYYPITVKKGKK